MGIISWIVLGFLAGCVASALTGKKAGSGCFPNIIVGMIGSLLGGMLVTLITEGELRITAFTSFNLTSLLISVLGAVIFLAILGAARKR